MKNDRHLDDVKNELQALSHPAFTRLLSTRDMIGVCGNGNHCDFFAGTIRSFSGNFAAVESFYDSAYPRRNFELRQLRDTSETITYCTFRHLRDWGIAPTSDSLYLVSFYENLPANSDLRCH